MLFRNLLLLLFLIGGLIFFGSWIAFGSTDEEEVESSGEPGEMQTPLEANIYRLDSFIIIDKPDEGQAYLDGLLGQGVRDSSYLFRLLTREVEISRRSKRLKGGDSVYLALSNRFKGFVRERDRAWGEWAYYYGVFKDIDWACNEADSLFKAAKHCFTHLEKPDSIWVARCLAALGDVGNFCNEEYHPQKVKLLYEAAIKILWPGTENFSKGLLADICHNYGGLLANEGYCGEALFYSRIAGIFKEKLSFSERTIANSVLQEGQVWYMLSRYQQAEKAFQQALNYYENLSGPSQTHAALLKDYANALLQMGCPDSAWYYGMKALDQYKSLLSKARDWDEIKFYQEELSLAYELLGTTLIEIGKSEKASTYLKYAINYLKGHEDYRSKASIYHKTGFLKQQLYIYDSAACDYARSAHLLTKKLTESQRELKEEEPEFLLELSKSWFYQGDVMALNGEKTGKKDYLLDALLAFKKSDSLISDISEHVFSPLSRMRFGSFKRELFTRTFDVAYLLFSQYTDSIPEAEREGYKKLALSASIKSRAIELRRKKLEETQLSKSRNAIQKKGLGFELCSWDFEEDHIVLPQETEKVALHWDLLPNSEAFPGDGEKTLPKHIGDALVPAFSSGQAFNGFADSLAEDIAVFEYLCTRENWYGIVHENKKSIPILIGSADQLLASVKKFRELVAEPPFKRDNAEWDKVYIKEATQLYLKLVEPLIKSLNGRLLSKLAIVGDGPLNGFPFAVLLVPERGMRAEMSDTHHYLDREPDFRKLPYLITKYSLEYPLSPERIHNNLEIPRHSSSLTISYTNDLAFAPLVRPRHVFPPLKGGRNTKRFVNAAYPGTYVSGSLANEAFLIKNAANYGILHITSHGITELDGTPGSMLVLNPCAGMDGLVSGGRIRQLPLKAHLAVLSLCESGRGYYAPGEGDISLAYSFLMAGTRQVISSLWPVSVHSTNMLMEKLYLQLGARKDVPEALRQAQINYLKSTDLAHARPYWWGGWQHQY